MITQAWLPGSVWRMRFQYWPVLHISKLNLFNRLWETHTHTHTVVLFSCLSLAVCLWNRCALCCRNQSVAQTGTAHILYISVYRDVNTLRCVCFLEGILSCVVDIYEWERNAFSKNVMMSCGADVNCQVLWSSESDPLWQTTLFN